MSTVTLSAHQPSLRPSLRRHGFPESTACDMCVGVQSPSDVDAYMAANFTDRTTKLYNFFIPGHGTSQFWLHPECADLINR